ncbi:Hypothetical protein CINCED_3A003883 [Cinara cedri]|nr:Hypothetical protein CINCED_3A003883 [Cinara cedri]
MQDYYFICVIFCSILTVFANQSTQVHNTRTSGNVKLPPPIIIYKNAPDFDVFSWRLCKALHEVEKTNSVISTISLKLVLLMLYEGAQGNTSRQLERVVGFNGSKQWTRDRYSQKIKSLKSHDANDYELDMGTKLFMDQHVQPNTQFLETIIRWYNSSFEIVDFRNPDSAVISINNWAKQITHGHIQQLLTEADTKENTALVLLNAVYFKGYWTYPFDKLLTKEGVFYLNSESTVNVSMMITLNSFKIANLPSLNSRLICLPYQGNKFVMYIILPDNIDGLNDLVNQINPVILGDTIKTMQSYMIKVVLPKFNFEYTSILGPILQKLGITDMFGVKADLKNIGIGPMGNNLIVSNVLQKAGLEVNEQGSIAHAATEVELDHRIGISVEDIFEVNRPFLFLIEDITMDTIVFVGKVTNPLSRGPTTVPIPLNNQ